MGADEKFYLGSCISLGVVWFGKRELGGGC